MRRASLISHAKPQEKLEKLGTTELWHTRRPQEAQAKKMGKRESRHRENGGEEKEKGTVAAFTFGYRRLDHGLCVRWNAPDAREHRI
jgi:hypothetical protein